MSMLFEKANWNTGNTAKVYKENFTADEHKKELYAKDRIVPGEHVRKLCEKLQVANVDSLKKYDDLVTAALANIPPETNPIKYETSKIHADRDTKSLLYKKVPIPSGRMQMLCQRQGISSRVSEIHQHKLCR